MYKDYKILASVPALNEEGKVGNTIKKIPRPLIDEVLVIDDGSTDNTYNESIEAGATVIKHIKNQGVGASTRDAIEYAIKNNFDIVICLGADDQEDKNEMFKHARLLVDKQYDYVHGSRYLGTEIKDMPISRAITTRLFTMLFNIACRRKLTDASNGFRGFKLKIFKDRSINIWRSGLDRYDLEPYLLFRVLKNKDIKFTEFPVKKIFDTSKGYTKMKPIIGWLNITKPLFLELFGLNNFYYKEKRNPKIDELLKNYQPKP